MNFILYRMVGGFIGLGPNKTTECRLRFALGIGLYMAFAAAVHHDTLPHITLIFAAGIAAAFAGRLIGHSQFQSGAAWWQILGMSWVGFGRLTLIILPYAFLLHEHTLWLNTAIASVSLFGLLQGPAYYFGWKLDGADSGIYYRNTRAQTKIRPGVILADENPATFLDQGAVGGSEWGELFTGIFAYNLPYLVLLVIP